MWNVFLYFKNTVLFFCHLSIVVIIMSKTGKSVYFLTFQYLSPRLTQQLLSSVKIVVDEIVTTFDSVGALQYAFIHAPRKVMEQDLSMALEALESSDRVKGSNIYGYSPISSSSTSSSELVEDHPGFRILVQHEERGNAQFNRWADVDNLSANCGYYRLKNKLLLSRPNASGGEGGSATGGNGTTSDDEEHVPRPSRTEESAENKRRRTASPPPDHVGGSSSSKNMVSLDVMMEKMSAAMSATISATMSATMSSVVASAINSSGAIYNKEREDARGSVLAEQQRREHAESQLYQAEIRMTQAMVDQRKIVEEEAAVKYRELEAKFQEMSQLKVVIFFQFIMMIIIIIIIMMFFHFAEGCRNQVGG